MRTLVNAVISLKNKKISKGELWKEIRRIIGTKDFVQIRKRGREIDVSIKTDRFERRKFYTKFSELNNEQRLLKARLEIRKKIKKALKRLSVDSELRFLEDLENNYIDKIDGFIVFKKDLRNLTIVGETIEAFRIMDKINDLREKFKGTCINFFDAIGKKGRRKITLKVVLYFDIRDISTIEKERMYRKIVRDIEGILEFERIAEVPEECHFPDRRFYVFSKEDLGCLYNKKIRKRSVKGLGKVASDCYYDKNEDRYYSSREISFEYDTEEITEEDWKEFDSLLYVEKLKLEESAF